MAAAKQPFDPLWQKIRHVIVLSLLGIQPYLQHHYTSARPTHCADQSACFELLGYDILLDDTGRPWLLEVCALEPSGCTHTLHSVVSVSTHACLLASACA